MLLTKNKKHAEHSIAHLCGAMERKNILTERDYKLQKYTT
jgi:hypothetical protein